MCTEIRIDEKKQGHLIDITTRAGSPASELQQEWIENFSEVIYECAKGNVVEPIFKTKYAAQIAFYSPITNDAQELTIPEDIKQWVKLYNYCGVNKVGSNIYGIIPIEEVKEPTVELGFVVGLGETPEECFEKIQGYFDQIEGEHLELQKGAIEEVTKEVKKLKKVLDIDF